MRLPPIRPPAKIPALWREHPELAPARRPVSSNFRAGAALAGLATRFPFHPVCGATTKRGTRCKAPQVAGANRCRYHGGGRILLRRARETLKKSRSRSVISKCLWYLEKALHNRVRQHLKPGERQLGIREEEAQHAARFIACAIRQGWATRDLVNSLHMVAEQTRPYRAQDITCAIGAYLSATSKCEPPAFRFAAFAAELQLNDDERFSAAKAMGLQLLEDRDPRDVNEQIGYELASRSLERRARKRQRK